MTNCLVCGDKNVRNYQKTGSYQFVKCDDCNFVFCHPMPSQEELNKLYTSNGTDHAVNFPKSASRRRRALGQSLRLWPYCRGGRRAIDIGCGGGFMVDAMRLMGADAYGIDLGSAEIAYATNNFPKCTYTQISYDNFQTEKKKFDFVYSSEVIEHVGDLNQYMSLISNITISGGAVYVTTPDIGSKNRPNNVLSWGPFDDPQHIQFFDEKSMTVLFEKYGFKVIRKVRDKKTGLKMFFRKP